MRSCHTPWSSWASPMWRIWLGGSGRPYAWIATRVSMCDPVRGMERITESDRTGVAAFSERRGWSRFRVSSIQNAIHSRAPQARVTIQTCRHGRQPGVTSERIYNPHRSFEIFERNPQSLRGSCQTRSDIIATYYRVIPRNDNATEPGVGARTNGSHRAFLHARGCPLCRHFPPIILNLRTRTRHFSIPRQRGRAQKKRLPTTRTGF